MPNEQNYQSHLLSIEEAMNHVTGGERKVLQYAWEIYCYTLSELEKERLRAEKETGDVTCSTVMMYLTFSIF
jgi:predicted transcriptional regulator